MENYLRPEICSTCGGKCCKGAPGAAFPDDALKFGNTVEDGVLSMLRSGHYVIDWWEGDPRKGKDELGRAYYIRPRTVDETDYGRWHYAGWGGTCHFLRSDGCVLKPDDRPTNCQLVEPKANGECVLHNGGSKQEACIAWLPWYDFLDRL